jgi:uncharacterized membrane protein
MTKTDFLTRLTGELKKKNIGDIDEIIGEYEQHFAFKLADGFSEEEISAKLGAPEAIAAQFSGSKNEIIRVSGGKLFIAAAMGFVALFESIIYILFFAWAAAIFASSIASAVIGASLIIRFDPTGLLPSMPYLSAAIFGICFLTFALFLAAGAYYSFAFASQAVKASVRWHKNVLSGNALPPLPWNPQFDAKLRRRLRTMLLWSLILFGSTMVLGMVVSQISSGALGFWHSWGWFVG